MVVRVTVWIAWQLNCIMPEVDINKAKPKGVCWTDQRTRQQHRARTHQQTDGQIFYSLSTFILHITNIVNQIDCDDLAGVLTPSIHWSCSTWKYSRWLHTKLTTTITIKKYKCMRTGCWIWIECLIHTFIFMDQTEKSLLITLDKYYN